MILSRFAQVLASSVLFLFAGMLMVAQGQGNGARQFQANCAGCHGADGRGSDKAPSITTMPSVVALSDADMIKIVHDGTAAGMPPFAQLGDANITAVVSYLRTLQGKTAVPDTAKVTGDAAAGRALYFGKAQCSSCHMVSIAGFGEGGFIASDLTGYGADHTANAIQQAIVQPDTTLDPASRVVEVQTKTGRKLTGVVRSEDNFDLALQTEDGRYHFLARSSLAKVNYTEHSLMPHDYGTRLTSKELNDLVSFLIVTGKNALAIKTGEVHGQVLKSAAQPAAKTGAPATDAGIGLIDVRQSDLKQPAIKDNWVSYNGDYSGRRYSSMTQITPANVSHLGVKWVFHTGEAGPLEVTPVVIAGVMFITSANDAYALDAKTGHELWHHARSITQGLIDDASSHHNRGIAILGTRIYMETDNAHLLCLDARSGNMIWDVLYATGNKNYGATSAPLIVKDKVVVGTSGGDDGVRGFLAAFDAQTGKEAWRFWTIPGPGEKGNESWPGDMYLHGGGAAWMPGTFDPALNTLYWGTGNPSPDYDGSVRPGDDLYTSSLLALDPDTGKLKWYFQYSPHNLYDYDAAQTPVLVNANFKGQPRKLIVTASRNGFLYILDRTNGKYLYSKKFTMDENWAKGIDENGRPIPTNLIPDEKGELICPSASGGTNWYSPSYNEATRMFYFRSMESCSIFTSKTEPFAEGREYYSTGTRRPPGEVTKGYINAFDLNKLEFAWRDRQIGPTFAWAGVMSTATGLVAFEDDARNFVILDGRTGTPLWHFNVGQMPRASPMGYAVKGKQYFAIAAGDDVFAFALP
jgi:alcohol dehydrogenase (cytochrome c)